MTVDRARPPAVAVAQVPPGRRWSTEVRDRLTASDPGFARLRSGLGASVSVGTALPVQMLVARLLGFSAAAGFATALFGAVVAMLGANALSGWDPWAKLRTGVFFPLAVGAGLVVAILTESERALQVGGFALVLFVAVWVRRFGPQWFSYGFLGWMGFFFATFLQATWALVPNLLTAAVVSTSWVLLLSTTVFRTRPRTALEATRQAFYARSRGVSRESADLLQTPPGATRRRQRALRQLGKQRSGVSETALLAEAWLAEPGSMPDGWSAPALRRRLIEAQQASERMAIGAIQLLDAEHSLKLMARQVLDLVARHEDAAALALADTLADRAEEIRESDRDSWWAVRLLTHGTRELLRFAATVTDPPEVDPGEDEFESATTFVNGVLPGSPAVARDVIARGQWNPFAKTAMTTRQAFQVAIAGVIAIGLGTWLSPTRYYWAVIAAFIMFTGTGSRSETFLKGMARVVGTLFGLVAAIALAHVTVGHKPLIIAAILIAIFFAFYFAKVSQAVMGFSITVLLGQLYTVLGTFSDSLLVLRLSETAVGALAGTIAALLFAPISTRDTVRAGRDEMLAVMADLLEAVATYAESLGRGLPSGRLDALVRSLDDRARKLALVAQPLLRPLVVGNSSPRTRQRLSLLVAAVSQCRALVLSLQAQPVAAPEATAQAARAIAQAVRLLADHAPGAEVPQATEFLATGSLALFDQPDAAHAENPVVRHLHHLSATLLQIAGTPNVVPAPRHRA